VAAATKATALAAAAVVADMAAAPAAKAPVAVAAVVVDAAALAATADQLGVKRFWSTQEKGLCGALFLCPQKQRHQGIGAHLAAPVAVHRHIEGGTNG